jgi:hypothetical protein
MRLIKLSDINPNQQLLFKQFKKQIEEYYEIYYKLGTYGFNGLKKYITNNSVNKRID